MSSLFYQSETVQINPTGDKPTAYIPLLQSARVSFAANRATTTRLNTFAPAKYRQANRWPSVSFSLDYIPTGTNVEEAIGLTGPNSVIDHLISGGGGYEIVDCKMQVKDLQAEGFGNRGTYNLRSGVLTNYSFQASVGSPPRTSLSINCLDIGFDSQDFYNPPPSDDDLPIFRPEDIEVSLPTGVIGVKSAMLQSFNLSIPLSRVSAFKLGSSKPKYRQLQSPVVAQVNMTALLEEMANTNRVSGDSSQIEDMVEGKWLEDDIVVRVKIPTTDGSASENAITYYMSRPYLESCNFSNSVGGFTSANLQFSVPVTFERTSGEGNLIIY